MPKRECRPVSQTQFNRKDLNKEKAFSSGKAKPVKKGQAFGLDDLFVNSLNLARDFCDKGD